MGTDMFKLIECPRDAMQGWQKPIATTDKVRYINQLLKVGFDTIDCGSFVSPKAIPQMADTAVVIPQLNNINSKTKLLVIVANQRGAQEAVQFDEINYLGFPFSISPTFQMRNTNSSMSESDQRVDEVISLCIKHKKELVIYMSMGFGNPYGDPYHEEILLEWTEKMIRKGVQIISLADTVGLASPDQISIALKTLKAQYAEVEWGVHLHSSAHNWEEKLSAAYIEGCVRFDGALKGIGGCPMAKDDLVGNMKTENILSFLQQRGHLSHINQDAFEASLDIANEIFVS